MVQSGNTRPRPRNGDAGGVAKRARNGAISATVPAAPTTPSSALVGTPPSVALDATPPVPVVAVCESFCARRAARIILGETGGIAAFEFEFVFVIVVLAPVIFQERARGRPGPIGFQRHHTQIRIYYPLYGGLL